MKILVTGGAGFIGSHIVDQLLSEGHTVLVADNLSSGRKSILNQKAVFFEIDIREDAIVDLCMSEQPDIVIHAAAQANLRFSFDNVFEDCSTNVLGTVKVLQACRQANIKRFIYLASGGSRVSNAPSAVSEKDVPSPISPYGLSKYLAERYVHLFNELYGLDYLIFCLTNIYGPRDLPGGGRLVPTFIHQMLHGEAPTIFGDGSQSRDFVYVVDLAKFIADVLTKETTAKTFYLGTGVDTTIAQVADSIKKQTGFEGDIHRTDFIKGELKNTLFDPSLAKEMLGWNPSTNIETGLRQTVEWFKSDEMSQL